MTGFAKYTYLLLNKTNLYLIHKTRLNKKSFLFLIKVYVQIIY